MIGNKDICEKCIHHSDSQYLGYCYLNVKKKTCTNGNKFKKKTNENKITFNT